ncbi:MAG: DNA topoisomerase VI subunit B [Phycisphaerae bacterium]|jgi:DNA topoisomerase-6 subunit B
MAKTTRTASVKSRKIAGKKSPPPRPGSAAKAAPPKGTIAPKPAPVKPVAAEATQAEPEAVRSTAARAKAPAYATAETMAKAQRSISISEFFAKNRHLLGFDNPRKALLTTVKEAVDNALDACEEAGVMPVVETWIQQTSETHFRIIVQDNGPGIVRKQIPSIFGQLLYGSKFHRLRMSRGQQGIGISAAGMYGLLTTGKPVRITSRISPRSPAHYYELMIDTRANRPVIIKDEAVEWDVPHGTRVEIELEARYQRGKTSVDEYMEQTAIANGHVTLIYHAPDGREERYAATTTVPPALPKEVRPHPHGIELGVLIKMMQDSRARTLQQFLTSEFSRVSPRVAGEILAKAALGSSPRPARLTGEQVKAVYHAIVQTKIMAPPTDSVVPIGEEKLIAGLKQVVEAGFYTATTRSPAVYRGNPFIIEVALAYGKPEAPETVRPAAAAEAEATAEGAAEAAQAAGDHEADSESDNELARLIRFANRVPLLYQQGACAITKAVAGMNWKSYGLAQSRGALPSGPLTVVVHMASVWVPFTSESKEAVASYPEILKELRLALQECGRRLGLHVRKGIRIGAEMKKRSYIEKYIPAIGEALRDILKLKDKEVASLCANLKDVLERSRKM